MIEIAGALGSSDTSLCVRCCCREVAGIPQPGCERAGGIRLNSVNPGTSCHICCRPQSINGLVPLSAGGCKLAQHLTQCCPVANLSGDVVSQFRLQKSTRNERHSGEDLSV